MLKQLRHAVMSVLVMTVTFGLIFPLVITLIAQAAFPRQANGSLINGADGLRAHETRTLSHEMG